MRWLSSQATNLAKMSITEPFNQPLNNRWVIYQIYIGIKGFVSDALVGNTAGMVLIGSEAYYPVRVAVDCLGQDAKLALRIRTMCSRN